MNENKEEKIKFSIIVPAHSENEILRRCLNSLVSQDYENIEILVVVNAATQGTKDVAFKASKEYSNIKVFYTDEPGLSNARNIGLDNAKGDIIGFCDADDWYQPGIVKNVADVFENEHCDIAICGFNTVGDKGEIIETRLAGQDFILSDEEYLIGILTNFNIMGFAWNKFISSRLIKDIRFNKKLKLMEDAEFNIHVIKNSEIFNNDLKINYINTIGNAYYQNPNSATHNVLDHSDHGKLGYIADLDTIENEFTLSEKEKDALNVAKIRDTFGILVLYYKYGMLHEPQFKDIIDNSRQNFLKSAHSMYAFSGADDDEKQSTFILANAIIEAEAEKKNKGKDDKPKFSIIVPAHNEDEMLLQSINSIENQDYENLEIIVVVNAATQGTKDAAKKASEEFHNIKIFNIDEPGVSNARNTGLENATGDIIGFCDADDWYEPGIINKVSQVFQNEKSDIVICGYSFAGAEGEKKDMQEGQDIELSEEDYFTRVLTDNNIAGVVWNKFFNSNLVENIMFDDKLKVGEDIEFCLHIVKNNKKLKINYINQIGYAYYQNPNSISHNMLENSEHGRLGGLISLDTIENECELSEKEKIAMGVVRVRVTLGPLLKCLNNEMYNEQKYKAVIENAREEFLKNAKYVYMSGYFSDDEKMNIFILANKLSTEWK